MEGLCIGIGISSGKVSFGEFGQSHRHLTAIGTVVNVAARAQSAARMGVDSGHESCPRSVHEQCRPKRWERTQLERFWSADRTL